MKRVMTFLICAAWLLAVAPVGAVEKKGKDEKKSTTLQTKQSTIKKDSLKTAKDSTKKPLGKQPAAISPSRKYDDFIDKNNNGIDDRKENLKRKAPADADKQKEADSSKTSK